MEVPWFLPKSHAVLSLYHHTGAADHTFPGGILGRCGEASSRYDIFVNGISLAVGCEWVFGLTAVWMHPCQVCLPTLADAAPKLLLLVDEGANWPYAYLRMNDTMEHMLLSSTGHIGITTSDLPSHNTCSYLHQLCVWQLLQCTGKVVCPEGLNGGLEPLMFDIKELPLWNLANAGESSMDLSMMDVDLGTAVHMASPSTWVEDPLGLSSRGTM